MLVELRDLPRRPVDPRESPATLARPGAGLNVVLALLIGLTLALCMSVNP
jgi:hypothetical protein